MNRSIHQHLSVGRKMRGAKILSIIALNLFLVSTSYGGECRIGSTATLTDNVRIRGANGEETLRPGTQVKIVHWVPLMQNIVADIEVLAPLDPATLASCNLASGYTLGLIVGKGNIHLQYTAPFSCF